MTTETKRTQTRRARAYKMLSDAEDHARMLPGGRAQIIDTGNIDTLGQPIRESCIGIVMDGNGALLYRYAFRDEFGWSRYDCDWQDVRDTLTRLIDHATYTPREPQPWQLRILAEQAAVERTR